MTCNLITFKINAHFDLYFESIWQIGTTNWMSHCFVEFARQQVQPTLYSYNVLRVATKDFHHDNELGKGGFGVVYKVNFAITWPLRICKWLEYYFELWSQFFSLILSFYFTFPLTKAFFLLCFIGNLSWWDRIGNQTINQISTRSWWFFKWSHSHHWCEA